MEVVTQSSIQSLKDYTKCLFQFHPRLSQISPSFQIVFHLTEYKLNSALISSLSISSNLNINLCL